MRAGTCDGHARHAVGPQPVGPGSNLLWGTGKRWRPEAAGRKVEVARNRVSVHDLRPDVPPVEEGAVRSKGRLDDEVAAERMAMVEGGIGLFRAQVRVVLRNGASAAAADGGRIVDGVRILVGRAQRDALVHPFVRAMVPPPPPPTEDASSM